MRLARARSSGFTLLEVVLAITTLLFVMMFVHAARQDPVRTPEKVRPDLHRPKVQNAVLGQIFRDFRYLPSRTEVTR